MENASKALIIAGAILLSILLIGLGMGVYNSATSSTRSANLDPQELQAHNSQFLAYEGKQKGANVRALMNLINANNRDYADRQVVYNISNTADNIENPSRATASTTQEAVVTFHENETDTIRNTTTYYVTFEYSDNGYVSGVEIHVYSEDCGTAEEEFDWQDL